MPDVGFAGGQRLAAATQVYTAPAPITVQDGCQSLLTFTHDDACLFARTCVCFEATRPPMLHFLTTPAGACSPAVWCGPLSSSAWEAQRRAFSAHPAPKMEPDMTSSYHGCTNRHIPTSTDPTPYWRTDLIKHFFPQAHPRLRCATLRSSGCGPTAPIAIYLSGRTAAAWTPKAATRTDVPASTTAPGADATTDEVA